MLSTVAVMEDAVSVAAGRESGLKGVKGSEEQGIESVTQSL